MRRVALLVLASGCASAGSTPEAITTKQPIIYAGPETGGVLRADQPHPSMLAIAAPPATVWAAVKQAYASIGVPVSLENPQAHQLGNQNFYKSRDLAGQPMTEFVDCGSGMTGPKAASYRIYMSLLTFVSADDKGGTVVQTTFVPMGQDISEGSTDRIPCGTTGRLEQLVLQKIKAAALIR